MRMELKIFLPTFDLQINLVFFVQQINTITTQAFFRKHTMMLFEAIFL